MTAASSSAGRSTAQVIVVTIDGFGVAAAGAYGQTSLPTPGWDTLATSSITFDFVDAPAASREAILATFAGSSQSSPSVAEPLKRLANSGASLRLAGDLKDFFHGSGGDFAACFDERSSFDLEPATSPSDDEDATQALRWLAKAEGEIRTLRSASEDRSHLLWLHHGGAYSPWDAPLEWREALRDEEDPPAYAEVAPAQLDARNDDRDPDRFLPYVFAWAGQAAAWDRLAEGLHLLWKRADAKRPTTMIVLGLRGYPLGEHGVVGDGAGATHGFALHEERLHIPFFVLPPGGAFPGRRALGVRRSDALLARLLGAAGDAAPESSLAELLEAESSCEPDLSAFVVAEEGPSQSVRTPLWRYVREGDRLRLYLKPDDKWEANDVASRRRDTVEAFERWLEERTKDPNLPLPEEATAL